MDRYFTPRSVATHKHANARHICLVIQCLTSPHSPGQISRVVTPQRTPWKFCDGRPTVCRSVGQSGAVVTTRSLMATIPADSKHWSGPSLRPQGSMFLFHSPLEKIMHPTRRHASGHKPRRGHYTSRCKHWSGLSQGRCRRKLTCLPPSEPCQHIARLGEATIPADANTGQAPH